MDRGLCRLTALPLLPAVWLQCRQCDIHKPGTASGELCRCLSALAGIPAPAQLCASLLGPDTCAGGTPRRQIFGSVMPCCRDFPMFSISQTGWHCSQALCPASCHTESEIKLLLKAGKTSSTVCSAIRCLLQGSGCGAACPEHTDTAQAQEGFLGLTHPSRYLHGALL